MRNNLNLHKLRSFFDGEFFKDLIQIAGSYFKVKEIK